MPNIPDRKLVLSERNPGRMFDIYEAPEVEHLYADSFGRSFLGPALTKLELIRVTEVRQEVHNGVQTNVEDREIYARLTIPTAGLIEICGVIMESLGASIPMFDESNRQLKELMKNAVRKASTVKF